MKNPCRAVPTGMILWICMLASSTVCAAAGKASCRIQHTACLWSINHAIQGRYPIPFYPVPHAVPLCYQSPRERASVARLFVPRIQIFRVVFVLESAFYQNISNRHVMSLQLPCLTKFADEHACMVHWELLLRLRLRYVTFRFA